MDNSIIHSMVCMPWAALYKYTILTCAVILFAPKDWGLQIKDFNKWHDTLCLPGKQNHLQQDEAMAMLKLIGMLFQSCKKGRFDQTETCTAPDRGLKLYVTLRYPTDTVSCKHNCETFFHTSPLVERQF